MPTDPIGGGPVDPNKPSQSNASGAPNFQPLQDAINSMADVTLQVAESLDAVVARLEKAAAAAARVAKETEGVTDSVKDAVNQTDKLGANLKKNLSLQKDFNNNIKG